MIEAAVRLGEHCNPILEALGLLAISLLVTSLITLARPGAHPPRQHVSIWRHACEWCGGLALMVGFLGTIAGMRNGMNSLSEGAGPIDLSILGGDLSYAFTTTLVGLCVSVLASFAHFLLVICEERP